MQIDPSSDRYARMVRRSLGVPEARVSLDPTDPCTRRVIEARGPVVGDGFAGWPITDHTGAVVGALSAVAAGPREWSAGDLEMLEDLATACSTELSQQDLAHRSRVLLALSESLSATRNLTDVARAVEGTSLEHLGCVRAGIWLRHVDDTGKRLHYLDHPGGSWASARNNRDLPLDETNPLGSAILRRQPLHFPDKRSQNELYPHLDTSQQVGDARSFVPLVSRNEVLGTLVLLWEATRELSEEDRVTIAALTSYAAQAVQRALLVQERLDALVTLQNSLLPRLPQPDSLELAARYRPAATRDQVGGDWYDAVVMPSGATSLMVGDVVGHDIAAAAVMGQLRNMLRAIAWSVDDAPSRNVTRLDQAMHDLAVDGMASLVYARIELADDGARTLRWANAGHPPPLVVGADGVPRLLEEGTPDLMVGVHPDAERADNRAAIEPDSLLLLYTDGLVERRGEDLTDGLERLREAAARHHGKPVDDFLDAVLADLVPGRLEDDVAVLAVKFLL